jgi:hypothetical protein
VFCRLEHVVPWVIRGARPNPDSDRDSGRGEGASCAQCGSELGEAPVRLLRHRGEARVADLFCSTDHLLEWAKAGGRWR